MFDGAVNFSPWKARIALILQENELWKIINNTSAHPVTIPTVATDKATFDKHDITEEKSYLMPLKTISYHTFLGKTMLIRCGLL